MSSPGDAGSLLYGFHPVREAMRHRPHAVLEVLVGSRRRGARRQEVEDLCARHRVPLREVPEGDLDRLAGGRHNGFVARMPEPAGHDAGIDGDLVVMVEDLQDPRNLGALLRVCEGVGVGRVLIRDRGSAPISPAVARTAVGATEWLSIERIINPVRSLGQLKDEGFWVYGADPSGVPPWRLDLSGRVVLCFGGEERGLRERTRGFCDALIGLPMRGRLESLNVSTAASAVLYEALRQREANRLERAVAGLPAKGESR